MKIHGLKVLSDKGWKADSTFTADDGRTMQIPANHKIVMQDENGDIVNATFVTPAPLTVKAGDKMDGLTLVGGVTKSQFGWSVKVAAPVKA